MAPTATPPEADEPRKRIAAVVEGIRARLAGAVDPVYKAGQLRFFKEPVDTWGVRASTLDAIERDVYRTIKVWPRDDRVEIATALWQSGKLEEGVLVCHVWRRFARQSTACDFDLFENWLDAYVSNWPQTDGLATWLLAGAIVNEPGLIARLAGWTTSNNRWKRRAAAVALLQEAKAGRHLDAVLDVARRLAEDRDDMVEKGVGWVLKEAYPKRAAEVLRFLLENRHRFSRTTLRYAAEKMSAADRNHLLHSKR